MCRKYSVFVHEGVGGVGSFIWSYEQCEWTILWNNFFCAPSLRPWSTPLFFCPFFAPLQSGPNLNPGPLFPPLVQSPHQATTPSVSGGEWGQRGEGGGAKRGASMPGQGATRSNYSKSYQTNPYHTPPQHQSTPQDVGCSVPCGHTISVRRWRYRRRHTQAVNP